MDDYSDISSDSSQAMDSDLHSTDDVDVDTMDEVVLLEDGDDDPQDDEVVVDFLADLVEVVVEVVLGIKKY